MTTTCGICLDHYLGSHCHTCGATKIGNKYYDLANGRLMARGIPRPVSHLVDNAVRYVQSLPDEV